MRNVLMRVCVVVATCSLVARRAHGGHTCQVVGESGMEIHQPGETFGVRIMKDLHRHQSHRYQECECPNALPKGVFRWKRHRYCKGVCYGEGGVKVYQYERFDIKMPRFSNWLFNCQCKGYGGYESCNLVPGGHRCELDGVEHGPSEVWMRTTRRGQQQECRCPPIWPTQNRRTFHPKDYCIDACDVIDGVGIPFGTQYQKQEGYYRYNCSCDQNGVKRCIPTACVCETKDNGGSWVAFNGEPLLLSSASRFTLGSVSKDYTLADCTWDVTLTTREDQTASLALSEVALYYGDTIGQPLKRYFFKSDGAAYKLAQRLSMPYNGTVPDMFGANGVLINQLEDETFHFHTVFNWDRCPFEAFIRVSGQDKSIALVIGKEMFGQRTLGDAHVCGGC